MNLACAFEVLLTDHYAPGVDARITERLALALRGVRGFRKMIKSIEGLYEARSSYVHLGDSDHDVDIAGARIAFARAFLQVTERVDQLPRKTAEPIRALLGA